MSIVDPLPALLFFDNQMARGPNTVMVAAVRPLCLHLPSFLLLLPVARRREVFGFPTGLKKRRLIPVCGRGSVCRKVWERLGSGLCLFGVWRRCRREAPS